MIDKMIQRRSGGEMKSTIKRVSKTVDEVKKIVEQLTTNGEATSITGKRATINTPFRRDSQDDELENKVDSYGLPLTP